MQDLAEQCATAQQLLVDHVQACCTKRESVRALARDVHRLKADVHRLLEELRRHVAAQDAAAADAAGAGADWERR